MSLELACRNSKLPGLQVQHQNGPPLMNKYHYLRQSLAPFEDYYFGVVLFPLVLFSGAVFDGNALDDLYL